MGKVLDLLSKGASAPAGDVTHVNEAKTAEEALAVLSKEARKALRETGLWNQEFHGNEIVAVIACFIASRNVLSQKESALTKAIQFIGYLENDKQLGGAAIAALESINKDLANETISQSIQKQKGNENA
uniref:hypothetical protein n=2 Tax=Bacteria TaxID=2 RepID=UPI0035C72971